jgi:hypothetical protein
MPQKTTKNGFSTSSISVLNYEKTVFNLAQGTESEMEICHSEIGRHFVICAPIFTKPGLIAF